MAWTSSAGPEDTFALAAGTGEAQNHPPTWSQRPAPGERTRAKSKSRPLALALIAHACGLAIVAPFALEQPVVAIPVLIGLAVTYVTLPRSLRAQVLAGGSLTNLRDDHAEAGPDMDENEKAPNLENVATFPPRLQRAATSAPPPLTTAKVSDALRADLMARVSHELRTPLNAVMGFSDLMGHQLHGPLGHPRYEEYVSHIRESSQKLLKSAEDTLAMTSLVAASSRRSERERFALEPIVADANSAMAAEASLRGIAYVVDVARDIEVIAHRRALRQALVNVLSEVHVRAPRGATVSLRAVASSEHVYLTVVIDKSEAFSDEGHHSLPICLARTLLELDGSCLLEDSSDRGNWSVTLALDHARQDDFFTERLAG